MNALLLKSGTEISYDTQAPIKKHVPKLVEVPTHREAQRKVLNVRKELSELPAPPNQMNALSTILSYQLFGLVPSDIAIATGITEQQVRTIQESDVYKELSSTIVDNIMAQDADEIRGLVQQQSRMALNNVVQLMYSETDQVALAASKDILDRAGHRPVDVIQHKYSMEGGLTIEIIKKDDTIQHPTIDISPGVM